MKNLLHTLFFFLLVTQICIAQWVQTSLTDESVYAFTVSGLNIFAGTSNGLFLSTDSGESWSTVLDSTLVHSLAGLDTNIFASTDMGFYRSTDSGMTWTNIGTGNFSTLAVSGTNLFAGRLGSFSFPAGGVFLSTDYGINWSAAGLENIGVNALALLGSNIFAGTWNQGICKSTDSGENWTTVGLMDTFVTAFAVLDNNIFAGTSHTVFWPGGGVYLSSNNGENWTTVGLIENNVSAFAISDNKIFTSTTNSGIFLSIENGANWVAVNSGLTNEEVYALAVLDTNLYAGTYLGGVWRRPLSQMITNVKVDEQIPGKFLLSQNYPNPFNSSTNIKYSIPQTSQVQIKIYDVLGNEIETLIKEENLAGTYELTWNAANLPSGVYLYQLNAGEFTSTKKVILLR